MHKADIKKVAQKAKPLLGKARLFAMTDPIRNPDLQNLIANTTSEIFIIYRTFGDPIPHLHKKDKSRVLASATPKIARKSGIIGIHIPNKSLKNYRASAACGLMKTASAHNLREISYAAKCGIKNIIISPIFPTKSKSAARALGKIKLAKLIRLFPHLDFIVLGGVNPNSIKRLKGVKIVGIAGVSFN